MWIKWMNPLKHSDTNLLYVPAAAFGEHAVYSTCVSYAPHNTQRLLSETAFTGSSL
jgi:hypothetical protein